MKSFCKVILILLPKNILTLFVGFLANRKISRYFILPFIKYYKINIDEIQNDIKSYKTLNDFFIRKLKPTSRSFKRGGENITSPVDGTIIQMGGIFNETLLQVKSKHYSLKLLLKSAEMAQKYNDGFFITIYLSPKDYHRIHYFCNGSIIKYNYIPGYLFPVNPFSINNRDELFAKNERLVTYFQVQEHSPALVKVGATIVGHIKTSYNQHKPHQKKPFAKKFEQPLLIEQGEELGYFKMGSTVILLFEKNSFKIKEKWKISDTIKLGELLGKLT